MKGTQDHATLAEVFNRDEDRVDWHDGALGGLGRNATVQQI